MAVADDNGDGRADVTFLDYRPDDLEKIQSGEPSTPLHYDVVTLHSRGGDASSFDETRQPTDWVRDATNLATQLKAGAKAAELAAADINADGRPDYVAFVRGTNKRNPVAILTARTQPEGPLALHEQPVPDALSAVENMITVGDANGDGREDLLVASRIYVSDGRPVAVGRLDVQLPLDAHRGAVGEDQTKALAAIASCRTAALTA